MITTTAEYKTAIDANARFIDGYVIVNYTDQLVDPTLSATSTNENRITQTEQAVNGRQDMTYKWASCEGSTLLDGTFHPCPDTPTLANFNEMGWWTDSDSGASKTFSVQPVIEATYASRTVASLLVVFDNKRMEYAEEFTIKVYQGAVLAHTETVTGNTSPTWQANITGVNNATKTTLTLVKWSVADYVGKVSSLQNGLVFNYGTDQITSMSVSEERELSNDNSLPVGNISANTFSLQMINKDRQFDANNTSSVIYNRVRPWVRMEPYIGVKVSGGTVEYVPMGVFWTKQWQVSEDSLDVSVDCQDRLALLETTEYSSGTLQINQTISDLFVEVLSDAGLDISEYNIDSTLDTATYTLPYSWFDKQSHRNALEVLASACGGCVYADRFGIIQIEAVDFLDGNNLTSVKTYDQSDYTSKGNPSVYSDVANQINVPITNITKTTGATIYTDSSDQEIEASTTTTYTIFPTEKVTDNQVASITPAVSGVTIIGQTWYSWGGNIQVQNTNGTAQTFKLSVTGDYYESTGGGNYSVEDADSIQNNGRSSYRYPTNLFLQNRVIAKDIGDSLLNSYKDPQRDMVVTFEPAGDPSLELGDRISITDDYTTEDFNIVRQDIVFDGGLSIKIEGRKAP